MRAEKKWLRAVRELNGYRRLFYVIKMQVSLGEPHL
jgi:hypothetical protein